MTKEDLINLKDRTPEERRNISVKGGLVKSEAKTLANVTKNLKHGRYARKFSVMVTELAKSPETSALKIFQLVEAISKDWSTLNPKLKIEIARLYMEAHRTCHGTKNLNVNLDGVLRTDLEKWFEDKK